MKKRFLKAEVKVQKVVSTKTSKTTRKIVQTLSRGELNGFSSFTQAEMLHEYYSSLMLRQVVIRRLLYAPIVGLCIKTSYNG